MVKTARKTSFDKVHQREGAVNAAHCNEGDQQVQTSYKGKKAVTY